MMFRKLPKQLFKQCLTNQGLSFLPFMHYDVSPLLTFRKPAVCCSALGNAQLVCLPDEGVCAVNIALGVNHLKTSTLVQKYFQVLKNVFFERV